MIFYFCLLCFQKRNCLLKEKLLDAQLEKFDKLDEDEFEILRQKRRQNFQKKVRQEQDWKLMGHGR